MFGEEAEGKLIKRITIIFKYYGKDSVEVDDALVTLFGRSGRNLTRIGKHMTFIISRDSGRSSVLAGGISSMFSKMNIESHIGEGGSKLEPNTEDGVSELEP
ncbi:hypothetical protein TrST_g2939 [Triparma strigata]|nr:hypothetical protein TrST_g2939 [Triparma strigata]